MKQWVLDAHHAEKLTASNDYKKIKSFVGKIGTIRRLTNKKASLRWGANWRILAERTKSSHGWGGRIRTCECQYQKLVPYHLATPQ